MDLAELAVNAGVGLGGAGTGASMVWWMIKTEVLDLRADLKRLREDHLAKMEHRVAKIEDRCTAEQTRVQMDGVKTTLLRIEGKVDQFTADVARLQTAQANTHEYVTHVDGELGAHRDDRALHGGRR